MDKILEMNKRKLIIVIWFIILRVQLIQQILLYGPMYTYDQLKNGDISLQQEEKQQKDFKKELNEITSEIQDIKAVINYM